MLPVSRKWLIVSVLWVGAAWAQDGYRPPAVPLVTHDPYFSVWSMADRLTDDATRHWTGTPHPLSAMLRVDGATYRLMGAEPRDVPAMKQTRLEVFPTRSVYSFEVPGVRVNATFLSPLLPHDLELVGRPVTYVTWDVRATDGKTHRAALYFDASTELAVNHPEEVIDGARFRVGMLDALRAGTRRQPVLEQSGDDVRIDWGYLYLAAPRDTGVASVITTGRDARAAFAKAGEIPDADDAEARPAGRTSAPALAFRFDLVAVGTAAVSRHVLLAYDDLYSIEYFERRLRPWWRRNGATAADLLRAAEKDYVSVCERARAFDQELTADLERAGGTSYARIATLAFRQAMAAHKLVADADGTPMFFPKENFSNGCIGTVDVIYPSAPMFLLFNPPLLEASLVPVMNYAQMGRWKFPFSPHDLGTYPLANGQVYGGREKSEDRQMPVEESGNMLLLAAALARVEGTPAFAQRYWPLLEHWAAYLKDKGLDPENQLSTDDFMGHLAHQANLSLKATLALGAFAQLCEVTGRKSQAETYRETARRFAARWVELADDGDHFRLAFDQPGSWGQKYNLVWDKLLELRLFPETVVKKELVSYRARQDAYGLPLDSRKRLTKLDWLVWTASLSADRGEFEAFIAPAYRFVNETPDRVPLADGHFTETARQRNKAQARSVVGGVFIRMLQDPQLWHKWAARASSK